MDALHAHTLHFVGIGGIGMSAVAKIAAKRGIKSQGSDIEDGYMISQLRECGIEVRVGHSEKNIGAATMIVRSTAIKDDHIEILEARKRGLPILHRSDALALLLDGYRTIAITGTHGKSTTTSIMGELCVMAGLDPTIVNGAIIEQFNDNIVIGSSKLAIIESDESDESFLTLPADIACITNMDPDHLDYYQTAENMYDSYMKFINKVPRDSFCFVCLDHPKIYEIISDTKNSNLITYGISTKADIIANNIRFQESGMIFDIEFSNSFLKTINSNINIIQDVSLSLYGYHNVQNCLPAIGTALFLGLEKQLIIKSLNKITGARRRFTRVGTIQDMTVIDDYAHHPVEIEATLSVASELAKINHGRVIAVMQPHRYTRLAAMLNDFGKAFAKADMIILTEVYSANEEPNGFDSRSLRQSLINNGKEVLSICQTPEELELLIKKHGLKNDLVIMLGAGDITKWAKHLCNH